MGKNRYSLKTHPRNTTIDDAGGEGEGCGEGNEKGANSTVRVRGGPVVSRSACVPSVWLVCDFASQKKETWPSTHLDLQLPKRKRDCSTPPIACGRTDPSEATNNTSLKGERSGYVMWVRCAMYL